MCHLLETLKVENRKIQNLAYHQARLDFSREKKFGLTDILDLKKLLEIPNELREGIYKCRVIYGKKIETIEFIPYESRQIKTLKLVQDDSIDYSFKYADREKIDRIYKKRETCDDILIVKNNLITDSSYCNVLFFDGDNWLTPEHPLLKGTKRQQLLDDKIIHEARILIKDLGKFQKFMLINAMLDFDEKRAQSINGIIGCV